VLPWFASVLLLLSYDFANVYPADLEIDSRGTVWVLSAFEPSITRLDSTGGRTTFLMDTRGLFSGLSVSATGRWAVSCPATGSILVFDRNDLFISEISLDSPGDIVFNDLDIWAVDTAGGSLVIPGGEVVARNCAARNSRLSAGRSGNVLVSGLKGVFLVEQGRGMERLAEAGSACITPGGILILQNHTLYFQNGDTLSTAPNGNRLSASPSGEIVVIWGGTVPMVLE
jgi:hypothetical protein